MINLHKHARKTAQWVVDSVMANGLAQQENEATTKDCARKSVAALARRAAAEGSVLLTNDGTLPLDPNEAVAVFGRCQIDWFFMGHGSGGNVHPPYTVNLLEGLDAASAQYNRVLARVYQLWCADANNAADPGWWGHWPTHLPEMSVSNDLVQAAACTSRTAIVVLGRCAGEDKDVPLVSGGYYLADDERTLLDIVTDTFERTVVVLNSGNIIDLSWIEQYEGKLAAVLLAWHGGMEAGNAVADVLYGKVNPSGRLSATVARDYIDYPSSATFGRRRQVAYSEEAYVGYRHFDTRAPHRVLFPFGHGLSYTCFEEEITQLDLFGKRVHACVRVTNTGSRAGRKVVLLWCEPPQATIPKPTRILAAFGKTEEIAPGHAQDLELTCDLKTLSSYDENLHAFVLEAGGYQFDCKGTASSIEVAEKMLVEQCTPLCDTSETLRERILAEMPPELSAVFKKDLSFVDVAAGRTSLDAFVAQLSNEDLEALTRGEGAMNSKLGTPGNAGAFGGVTQALRERGIPAAICADGPSGARLQRQCSLLPCATALACTFDTELVKNLYAELGLELRDNGIDVLLAPGMNIQRNPRCGRNFEYFSEDPLVSGRMAAAVVRGLQDTGISACPKHFACNNQEAHRNTSDSRMSERTLREIYLRGFEICIQEAKPDLIMTSYNKVNGVWAHYHYDLATTILRNEWGFDGVVITDWWMRPAKSPEFPELRDNAYRIRAGVDVLMPGSMSHVLSVPAPAHGITRGELQRSARRVLAYLLRRFASFQTQSEL